MKVSLNWVKKYVDLPSDVTEKQIAYDLTLRTVEVESVENTKEKFHDIVLKDREMMIGKVRGITDICLEGRSISRVHARISQDQEGCSITDLGSTNGTYVNGTRLAERQRKYLQQGDEVRIAEAVFVFQTEETEILRSQQLSDVI